MRRWLWVGIVLLLAGCGVQVEVATPAVPTPTPRLFPEIDYSNGGVWREQAAPRIVFPDATQAQVQLFVQGDQSPIFVIQGRPLWLVVSYDATWFASPQSNAQVRLSVYTRTGDTWDAYDTTQDNLTAADVPTNTHSELVVTLYLEAPGILNVRAEVTVVAYPANGDISTSLQTNEFLVIVLADPGEIQTDAAALVPALDGWDANRLLMDWRGWRGGPCGEWGDAAACTAFGEDDLDGGLAALRAAADASDDPTEAAARFDQLGLIDATMGDYTGARDAFMRALEGHAQAGDALALGITAHNLMTVQWMGEDDEGWGTLWRLQELRGQFYDEAGNMLTQANAALMSGETWRLDEPHAYFDALGLPQADILEIWRAA